MEGVSLSGSKLNSTNLTLSILSFFNCSCTILRLLVVIGQTSGQLVYIKLITVIFPLKSSGKITLLLSWFINENAEPIFLFSGNLFPQLSKKMDKGIITKKIKYLGKFPKTGLNILK